MQLTEHWSNVVKLTTAAYSQKYQLTGNFLNKYTNRYMQCIVVNEILKYLA